MSHVLWCMQCMLFSGILMDLYIHVYIALMCLTCPGPNITRHFALDCLPMCWCWSVSSLFASKMYDKVAPPSVRNELTFLCQAVPRSQTNAPKKIISVVRRRIFPQFLALSGRKLDSFLFFDKWIRLAAVLDFVKPSPAATAEKVTFSTSLPPPKEFRN